MFSRIRNFTKAIEHYQYCIKINPNKNQPYHYLGVCFKNIGDYQKAINYFNESNKINFNSDSLTSLGNTYQEMGKFLDAKKHFQKHLNLIILSQEQKFHLLILKYILMNMMKQKKISKSN